MLTIQSFYHLRGMRAPSYRTRASVLPFVCFLHFLRRTFSFFTFCPAGRRCFRTILAALTLIHCVLAFRDFRPSGGSLQ